MVAYRWLFPLSAALGLAALAGCEQGNAPPGPASTVAPDAAKSSEDAMKNNMKNAPNPTKRVNRPPPPPPASK